MFDDLDSLDDELLTHFAARFPKPTTIDFSEHDVDPEHAAKLCEEPRLYANQDLIWTFVRHNRLGMFGDWRDFPAFVGDLAVFCRRRPLMMDGDHAFFFLHLAEHGAFDGEDRALLRRWIEDILMPWQRPLRRLMPHWCGQESSYLGLLIELGGDVHEVLRRNLERSRFDEPTPLTRALIDGSMHESRFRDHFEQLAMIDNQAPPTPNFVRASLADEVWRTIRAFGDAIPAAPTEPIDDDALLDALCDDDPGQVERALLALEAARWYRREFWSPTVDFPFACFDAFDVVPARLVEAYLSITEDYARDVGIGDYGDVCWSQAQAVFVHGDGRAAAALATCVLGHPDQGVEELLRAMWDVLGEPDHPCHASRAEGARTLMHRLLSSDSARRACIDKMGLWDGALRTEVAMPLLELLSRSERAEIEASWAES